MHDDFVPKKKVATPAQKKSLELAHAKKKPENKKSLRSDNKENEPPVNAKASTSKRHLKEISKE
jgi:hypothetical protein